MIGVNIIGDRGEWTEGRLPQGRYPVLWLITPEGQIVVGPSAIEKAERVARRLRDNGKGGHWSGWVYTLTGKNGDLFVSVVRKMSTPAWNGAHSLLEARDWFAEAVGRPVDFASCAEALKGGWSHRYDELVALDEAVARLEEENSTDAEAAEFVTRTVKFTRASFGRHMGSLDVPGGGHVSLTLTDKEVGTIEELPEGAKVVSFVKTACRWGGTWEAVIAVPAAGDCAPDGK